jgi:hypothetical protein
MGPHAHLFIPNPCEEDRDFIEKNAYLQFNFILNVGTKNFRRSPMKKSRRQQTRNLRKYREEVEE